MMFNEKCSTVGFHTYNFLYWLKNKSNISHTFQVHYYLDLVSYQVVKLIIHQVCILGFSETTIPVVPLLKPI